VVRLVRLAVDASAQSRGVGQALLRHVFVLALKMAEGYGCIGIVVDAKPGAVEFYSRFGFEPLDAVAGQMGSRPAPRPMFLPLEHITVCLARRRR